LGRSFQPFGYAGECENGAARVNFPQAFDKAIANKKPLIDDNNRGRLSVGKERFTVDPPGLGRNGGRFAQRLNISSRSVWPGRRPCTRYHK
jgi:hypothetical protein